MRCNTDEGPGHLRFPGLRVRDGEMQGHSYTRRRDEVAVYFDRTALDAWQRFATNEPLGRIRTTVRAGRDRMRAAMLSMLPDNLEGWRILDAGCGAGVMSVELARRGADVIGVDLSPGIISYATAHLPRIEGQGRIHLVLRRHAFFRTWRVRCSRRHGFADPLPAEGCRGGCWRRSLRAPGARSSSPFHRAPWRFRQCTPSGASSRAATARLPSSRSRLRRCRGSSPLTATCAGWHAGRTGRVSGGFYISQALEIIRT